MTFPCPESWGEKSGKQKIYVILFYEKNGLQWLHMGRILLNIELGKTESFFKTVGI